MFISFVIDYSFVLVVVGHARVCDLGNQTVLDHCTDCTDVNSLVHFSERKKAS